MNFTNVKLQTEHKKKKNKTKKKKKNKKTNKSGVHLKAFGHGICGDVLYQSRSERHKMQNLVEKGVCEDRLYLHAHTLTFVPF